MARLIECSVLVWINMNYFLWAYSLKYTLTKNTQQFLLSVIKGNVGRARQFLVGYFSHAAPLAEQSAVPPVDPPTTSAERLDGNNE